MVLVRLLIKPEGKPHPGNKYGVQATISDEDEGEGVPCPAIVGRPVNVKPVRERLLEAGVEVEVAMTGESRVLLGVVLVLLL